MKTNVVELVDGLNVALDNAGMRPLSERQWSVALGYLSIVFWNIDAKLERLASIDAETPLPARVE